MAYKKHGKICSLLRAASFFLYLPFFGRMDREAASSETADEYSLEQAEASSCLLGLLPLEELDNHGPAWRLLMSPRRWILLRKEQRSSTNLWLSSSTSSIHLDIVITRLVCYHVPRNITFSLCPICSAISIVFFLVFRQSQLTQLFPNVIENAIKPRSSYTTIRYHFQSCNAASPSNIHGSQES